MSKMLGGPDAGNEQAYGIQNKKEDTDAIHCVQRFLFVPFTFNEKQDNMQIQCGDENDRGMFDSKKKKARFGMRSDERRPKRAAP
jgi:hypothetical protein